MKKFFLAPLLFFIAVSSFAQKKAITETGDEVILYDDGTWKYIRDSLKNDTEIKTNPKDFKKNNASNFLLKSTKFNVGVWINPQKWSFKKADDDGEGEYEMTLKGKDLYGMFISETIEAPLETLRTIALENAKSAAPDIRIIKEEYRKVNNIKVLFMQMNGTIKGIKFTYYGYYFSNEKGALQFLTYTAQNLFDKYVAEMEDLLNGLVQTE